VPNDGSRAWRSQSWRKIVTARVCQTIEGAAHCDVSVGDSWGRLVSQWSGHWMWALLFCTRFSAWSAASAACEAAAWRRIVLVTGVRSEPRCYALAGACWSSMLERHATEKGNYHFIIYALTRPWIVFQLVTVVAIYSQITTVGQLLHAHFTQLVQRWSNGIPKKSKFYEFYEISEYKRPQGRIHCATSTNVQRLYIQVI